MHTSIKNWLVLYRVFCGLMCVLLIHYLWFYAVLCDVVFISIQQDVCSCFVFILIHNIPLEKEQFFYVYFLIKERSKGTCLPWNWTLFYFTSQSTSVVLYSTILPQKQLSFYHSIIYLFKKQKKHYCWTLFAHVNTVPSP